VRDPGNEHAKRRRFLVAPDLVLLSPYVLEHGIERSDEGLDLLVLRGKWQFARTPLVDGYQPRLQFTQRTHHAMREKQSARQAEQHDHDEGAEQGEPCPARRFGEHLPLAARHRPRGFGQRVPGLANRFARRQLAGSVE
jgi:hypothetical protein